MQKWLLISILTVLASCASTVSHWQLNTAKDDEISFAFDQGVFVHDSPSQATIVCIQGPTDQPDALLITQLLWRPSFGQTPIETTATNATFKLIRFLPNKKAETYTGSGFVFFKKPRINKLLNAECWDADIILSDFSPSIKPSHPGQHKAKGLIRANYDADQVKLWIDQTEARLQECLQ